MKTFFLKALFFTFNLGLLTISYLISNDVIAQNIGINGSGANAHSSALLDVDATSTPSLGILIPRIALQAINIAAPVSSPATSLLVYNTASASSGTNVVSAGYYYWDATKWVRFSYSPSGTSAFDWNTLGNAGTSSSTHFLGTTDAQDLVFRTNNVEKMRILSGGNIGIGTSSPAYRLQVANTDPSIAIGIYSQFNPVLTANTASNLHATWSSMQPNSTFNFTGTLYGSVNRIQVLAGQTGSVFGAYGSTNDFSNLGTALVNNANGSIHYVSNQAAGVITNAQGAYFEVQNLGSGSITNAYGVSIGAVQGTNKWSLFANDAAAPSYFAGSVGIGTSTPSEKLQVNGSVKIVDGTQATDNILSSDANGKGSWQDRGYALGTYYGYPATTTRTVSPSAEGVIFSGIIIPYDGFYLFSSNTPMTTTSGLAPNSEIYLYLCNTSAPYNAYINGGLQYFLYNNEVRISSNNVTEGICFLTAGSYDVRLLNNATNVSIRNTGHNFALKSVIKL